MDTHDDHEKQAKELFEQRAAELRKGPDGMRQRGRNVPTPGTTRQSHKLVGRPTATTPTADTFVKVEINFSRDEWDALVRVANAHPDKASRNPVRMAHAVLRAWLVNKGLVTSDGKRKNGA